MNPDFDNQGHTKCDRGASNCDDQLATIHSAGRGVAGDSYRVVIDRDDTDETYLKGRIYDPRTKTWTDDWTSENINGGELKLFYNLRPYTVPKTYTITFVYSRPTRPDWSWTSPAMGYYEELDENGEVKTDPIVGSGVGNLFIKVDGDSQGWQRKLIFPPGTDETNFNSPTAPPNGGPIDPTDPNRIWGVYLNFGVNGDVQVVNVNDLSKVLGITVEQITNIVNNQTGVIDGSDNIKDYIDDLEDHIHADMGFPPGSLIGDGGHHEPDKPWDTIKEYIDWKLSNIAIEIRNHYEYLIGDIVNHIYGATTLSDDPTPTPTPDHIGQIVWPGNIATGNMNVFGGTITNTGSTIDSKTAWIMTHDGLNSNDVSAL